MMGSVRQGWEDSDRCAVMSDDGRQRPMPRRQQGAEGGRPLRPVTKHGPADPAGRSSLREVWLPVSLFLLSLGLVVNVALGPLGAETIRYHFSTSMRNQLIGLDAVTLLVVVPMALVVGVMAWRRHPSASVLAIAPGLFVAYMLPQYIVGPDYLNLPGNNQRFFLLHLSLFVLGVAVAVIGWTTIDDDRLPDVSDGAAYLASRVLFVGALFLVVALHLPGIIDALSATPTNAAFRDSPTAFYVVKLMDLGLIVPASIVVGVGLSHRRPWATKMMYPLIGWLALDAIAVSAMAIVMEVNNDPTGSMVLVVGFVTLTLVLVLLTVHLWRPLAHPVKGYRSIARQ